MLATPALLYGFVVKPYAASLRILDAELETQSGLLARERALVANTASVRRYFATTSIAAGTARQRLYSEQDPIAATSELSRDIARAFDDAGVPLQRIETHESTLRSDGLHELAIDVRADGDFEGILTAIGSLERRDRLMRIARITIDGASSALSREGSISSDKGAPAGQRLTIVATIRAYAP